MLIAKTLLCVLIFLAGETPMLSNYLSTPNQIIVYQDNVSNIYENGSNQFSDIINEIYNLTIDSHEMPAFSVSLDHETRQAMQEGIWIELIYNSTHSHNEMPFDSLLIQVNPDYTGFNIIRKHQDKYEGRCFYIDTNKNMSSLYQKILNISK